VCIYCIISDPNYKEEVDQEVATSQTVEGEATDASTPSRTESPVPMDPGFTWTQSATKLFIQLRGDASDDFADPKTKKKQSWNKLVQKMSQHGYVCTIAQVENKWKNLTKKFRDITDHNSISGNSRKSCPYFDEMSEYYGYRPNVNPKVTSETVDVQVPGCSKDNICTPVIATPKGNSKKRKRTVTASSTSSIEAEIEVPTPTRWGSKGKRHRLSQGQEMVKVVKEIHMEQQKAETSRQELAHKMHKEKMDKLQQFIDVIKNIK
jgi:hypothetical protein